MHYPVLFTPADIGRVTIKNRLIMTAAGCELTTEDGEITEGYLAYYEARAKGGVGAIITELMQVDPDTGVMNRNQVRLWDDSCVAQLEKLARRIHPYDCKVFVQLQHPGNVAKPQNLRVTPPVSASDVSNLIYQQPIRPMTVEEIHTLTDRFAQAALRVKQAGIDGVEIHAAHFYLLHQFLSPYFNHRTDEYGGSLENRLRIVKEILEKTRKLTGPEFPILVRVSAEEYFPQGGYHLDEGIEICKKLEEYGADAINVTVAGTGCKYGQSLEPISFPQGWRKHIPAAVKKFVSIPVIGVAMIRDPDYAQRMVEKGYMDFVGSARNYVADPEWANKVAEGRTDQLRRCISCLRCIQGIVAGESISCSVNPLCGREDSAAQIAVDGEGRLVVILGGGPAGMQAAVTAAQRGFSVRLYEAEKQLGGQLKLAATAPNKEKIFWFIEYLRGEMARLGVEVRLGCSPTQEELENLHPYGIIDATGAVPVVPRSMAVIPGYVFTPDQVLSGQAAFCDAHIVIVGSGMTGLETAEYLTAQGNMVTLVEMGDKVAPQAYGTQIMDVMKHLEVANTVVMTSTALEEICEGYVKLRKVDSGVVTNLPADGVVLSLGVRPAKPYGDRLAGLAQRVFTVGDACRSGRIIDATRTGYDAACQL